jgi:hypothetical protein
MSARRVVAIVSLFAFGLSVPVLSTAGLLVAAAQSAANVASGWSRRFVRRAALLFLFSCTYYALAVSYGFVETGQAAKYSLYPAVAYTIGYHVCGRLPHASFPWGELLAPVLGLVVFSALCVAVTAGGELGVVELTTRAALNVWVPGEAINAPALGALASCGICLLPALAVQVLSLRLASVPLFAVTAAAVGMGFYANIALQNRTPFIALGVSILLVGWHYLLRSPGVSALARVLRVFVILAAVSALASLSLNADGLHSLAIYQRFTEEGLTTPRYELWARVAAGILDEPWGGRRIYLGTEYYAHNAWLDVAYDAGIVPLVLLVMFHALHVKYALAALRVSREGVASTLLLGVGASFLTTFAAEPVMSVSMIYFAVAALVLGFVFRMGEAASHRRPV